MNNTISPGSHELLTVALRALAAEGDISGKGNVSVIAGALRVLLRGGAPSDADCRVIAHVLANACDVSNDPDDGEDS